MDSMQSQDLLDSREMLPEQIEHGRQSVDARNTDFFEYLRECEMSEASIN